MRITKTLPISYTQKISENPALLPDLLSCLLWKPVWEWAFRMVFENPIDPTTIIKLEWWSDRCNIREYDVWSVVSWFIWPMKRVKDWFAPVEWISPCWMVLCMKKTKPLPEWYVMPETFPVALQDIKPDNLWLYKWKLVCHDYWQLTNILFCQSWRKKKVKRIDN